jgi:hypothetical protein
MSAVDRFRERLKRAAGSAVIAALTLLIAWPGHIVALPSALTAAVGGGTPGVFTAEQKVGGKSELWTGTFGSDDGTVVLPGTKVNPGWGSFRAGQRVPATYTPLPDGWWVLGYEVHPRSGNADWAYPLATAMVWTGLVMWAALRLRRRLRPAGPQPGRNSHTQVTAPTCRCADPDRCRRG